ncbi:MAG TPA: c-type cytochrome [Candidatus Sulfotelmatobacter sp.]|jgi:mono/diheme cytochrome c family protein
MIRSSGVALALFVSCSLFSSAQESKIEGLTGNANAGKALYRRYCITCHGVHGDGAGENAPHLDPKPRDFTKAAFKCRSTPSGDLPTDSDLYDTISRGIYNSAMPPWRPLTRQQRADLIAYIKTFSPRFHEEPPVASVVIPPEPPTSAESVQRGAALFQSMNCWSCHGKEGRGNGPSALTLTDSKGYPILPFDFTKAPYFKCGETPRDVFKDLSTGLDGTPMPSFADSLKPDQIWDVVHYIQIFAEGNRSFFHRAKSEGKLQ